MRFLWEMKDVSKFTARHPILTLCAIAVMALPSITRGQIKDTTSSRPIVIDGRRTDVSPSTATTVKGTNTVVIEGFIVNANLKNLGGAKFEGTEKSIPINVPNFGVAYIFLNENWTGIACVIEPAPGDTTWRAGSFPASDSSKTKPNMRAENYGLLTIATEKGIWIMNGAAIDYVNLDIKTLDIVKLEIVKDKRTASLSILVSLADGRVWRVNPVNKSVLREPVPLGMKSNGVPSKTPLWRERADSLVPVLIDSTAPAPIH